MEGELTPIWGPTMNWGKIKKTILIGVLTKGPKKKNHAIRKPLPSK